MPGSEPKHLVLSEPPLRAQGRLLSRPCALRGQIWSIRLVRGEPLTSLRLKAGGHLTKTRPSGQSSLCHARSTYVPAVVLTRIKSSVETKSGTCTTSPVSVVAGLVPPVAVSPLNPGSV